MLKKFEDYLNEGIVKKRIPDLSRAKSLIKETERRRAFLKEIQSRIKLSDENANYFIENSYDLLIELIRAKLFVDGFKSSGEGAHEAEVSYLRNLNFSEDEVRFIDQLRYFRNGIKYYGKCFSKEYAEKVLSFLGRICPKLRKSISL